MHADSASGRVANAATSSVLKAACRAAGLRHSHGEATTPAA